MHRKSVRVKACLLLASAAGLALLSACGGGGGGGGGGVSGPQATITPRNRVAVPLTGVTFQLTSSTSRRANILLSTQPEGSLWSQIVYFVEPFNAGRICCDNTLYNKDVLFGFNCAAGYKGEAVVGADVKDLGGNEAVGSLRFTCG